MGSVLCIVFGGDPVLVFAPVWLHQGGIDVGGCDGGALGAHGLYEAGGGEVDAVAEDAAGTGGDQVQGCGVQSAVSELLRAELRRTRFAELRS